MLYKVPFIPEEEKLNVVDDNFKLIPLSSNMTSLLQPKDQRVTEKLKKLYKKQVLRYSLLVGDKESVAASKGLPLHGGWCLEQAVEKKEEKMKKLTM